jgi:hypothetical protein
MAMKVLIVGLPYFSKELASNLQNKYPNDIFLSLDTYYSKKDQLKFLFHILTADIVHSINGTLGKSKVLELAMKLKKKIIFHWVGTDLIKSTELFEKNMHNPAFISYPTHITDSPWYVDKLEKLGMSSKFIPLKGFEKEYEIEEFKNEFNVLCYISQHRAKYYGIEQIIEIAQQIPNITFNLVGINDYEDKLPINIKLNGWVKNMNDWIINSTICLRLPKTDGLSFFVLESLAYGRYVAYNQDFNYSYKCITTEEFVAYIKHKKSLFDNKELLPNTEVARKVTQEFSSEKVLNSIYNIYSNS